MHGALLTSYGWVLISVSPLDLDQWSVPLSVVLIVLLAFQQWRLYRLRKESAKREELFRIVAENAADMIALVDVKGHRLYNSPAYERVLGYSKDELAKTSSFEQIHPEDRMKVLDASREAKSSGVGQKMEYHIRHKDGTWRVLESTASTILDSHGEVEKLVIINRDITKRKQAEEALEHNSFHDSLTTLPNRRLFLDRLQRAFVRAARNADYRYAVLFVDVDGFKAFNDSMGTEAGDQILKEVGQRLGSCLRGDDTVARPQGKLPIDDMLSRMGGDEFTVLLEGIHDPSDAIRVAKRIQAAVSQPLTIAGREILVTVSAGIALSNTPHERPEDLLQDADTAMRRAKARGSSRCEVFDEAMQRRALGKLALESELQAAIDRDEFQLCYQPIVQMETRRVLGFEALLRWEHPEQGIVSPCKFIDVAENAGLIVAIGKQVLRKAGRQLSDWQSKYPALGSLTMTVNLSPQQLSNARLVSDLKAVLQETGVQSGMQLEIAEGVLTADPKFAADVLPQLKRLGLGISVGDFGSSVSSISWLRRLPLDELKIDRALMASTSTDALSRDVVALLVSLAHGLRARLVAEGIETTTQMNLLRKLGCEYGQGFLFAQPLDALSAEQLLKNQLAQSARA